MQNRAKLKYDTGKTADLDKFTYALIYVGMKLRLSL
jgi:hypothetical protein